MKLSESIVYISGPYRAPTIFGVIWNIYKARRASKRWWGTNPVICPHLNTAFFGGDVKYIEGDLEIIRRLHKKDIMFMLSGWENSQGSCRELELAIERGLQVKYERPPVFTPLEPDSVRVNVIDYLRPEGVQ